MDSSPQAQTPTGEALAKKSTKKSIRLIIVSGRSGAGKTIALRVLEDLGFYCVDNLPIQLLPTLLHSLTHYPSIAVSIDVRNISKNQQDLKEALEFLPDQVEPELLFVDAHDDVLLRRYGETRRIHPLSRHETSLPAAIALESQMLASLKDQADWHIDTSRLSIHELSEQVREHVLGRKDNQLIITFLSFGFKHGIPNNADMVFDARILPNPHWEPALRPYTGLDEPVAHYLGNQPLVTKFIQQVENFTATWLPYFERSNRSYLTIAIGCTGGQHRSVYICEVLGKRFNELKIPAHVKHRELDALKKHA